MLGFRHSWIMHAHTSKWRMFLSAATCNVVVLRRMKTVWRRSASPTGFMLDPRRRVRLMRLSRNKSFFRRENWNARYRECPPTEQSPEKIGVDSWYVKKIRLHSRLYRVEKSMFSFMTKEAREARVLHKLKIMKIDAKKTIEISKANKRGSHWLSIRAPAPLIYTLFMSFRIEG